MATNEISPRVNSARLPDYKGRAVRLVGEVVKVCHAFSRSFTRIYTSFFQNDESSGIAILKASDGGEVRIKLLAGAVGRAVMKSMF